MRAHQRRGRPPPPARRAPPPPPSPPLPRRPRAGRPRTEGCPRREKNPSRQSRGREGLGTTKGENRKGRERERITQLTRGTDDSKPMNSARRFNGRSQWHSARRRRLAMWARGVDERPGCLSAATMPTGGGHRIGRRPERLGLLCSLSLSLLSLSFDDIERGRPSSAPVSRSAFPHAVWRMRNAMSQGNAGEERLSLASPSRSAQPPLSVSPLFTHSPNSDSLSLCRSSQRLHSLQLQHSTLIPHQHRISIHLPLSLYTTSVSVYIALEELRQDGKTSASHHTAPPLPLLSSLASAAAAFSLLCRVSLPRPLAALRPHPLARSFSLSSYRPFLLFSASRSVALPWLPSLPCDIAGASAPPRSVRPIVRAVPSD